MQECYKVDSAVLLAKQHLSCWGRRGGSGCKRKVKKRGALNYIRTELKANLWVGCLATKHGDETIQSMR